MCKSIGPLEADSLVLAGARGGAGRRAWEERENFHDDDVILGAPAKNTADSAVLQVDFKVVCVCVHVEK